MNADASPAGKPPGEEAESSSVAKTPAVALQLVLGLGLAVLAAQVPLRARPVGLFAAGLGLVTGLLSARLQAVAPVSSRSTGRLLAAGLAAVVVSGQTWLGFDQLRRQSLAAEARQDRQAVAELSTQSKTLSPESAAAAIQMARRERAEYRAEQQSFQAYLHRRLTGLGFSPQHSPAWDYGLFAVEILLAAAAAGWIAGRTWGLAGGPAGAPEDSKTG